jgi:hypothetical protein
MSLFDFNWLGSIFKPVADIVDELHDSKEELGNIEIKKLELRNKLAEIQSSIALKGLELQGLVIEANSKAAIAEAGSTNWLTSSWRPVASLAMVSTLLGMGYGFVEWNELLAQICGAFLGIYGISRGAEKTIGGK